MRCCDLLLPNGSDRKFLCSSVRNRLIELHYTYIHNGGKGCFRLVCTHKLNDVPFYYAKSSRYTLCLRLKF